MEELELDTDVQMVFPLHSALPTFVTIGRPGNMSPLKLPTTNLPYLLIGSWTTLPKETVGVVGAITEQVLGAEMVILGPIR